MLLIGAYQVFSVHCLSIFNISVISFLTLMLNYMETTAIFHVVTQPTKLHYVYGGIKWIQYRTLL